MQWGLGGSSRNTKGLQRSSKESASETTMREEEAMKVMVSSTCYDSQGRESVEAVSCRQGGIKMKIKIKIKRERESELVKGEKTLRK